MAVPPAPRIPGAYLSLLSVSFFQLRKDLDQLIRAGWAEPERRRTAELAESLADACQGQGLKDVHLHARSLSNLTRLSAEKARPILAALKEKFDATLREGERLLANYGRLRTG